MSKYHLNTLRGPRREHRPCPVPDAQPSTRPSTPAVPAGSASAALCCPTQGVHLNRPLAYHLRKLRELQDRGRGRPALGLEIGITLAETAENPRHGPPARHRDRKQGRAERAERSETHFSGPIPVRKYSWDGHWKEKWHGRRPVRQLVGSWAGQWELADVGSMVPTYSGWPWRSSASHQKIPNLFNEGKLQTPGNGAYLFRPSASQSSDRDAQVGTVEIEGLARKHARFGGAVSRPSRSAAPPALSAWPAWHPPRPARSSSAPDIAAPAPGSAPRPCRRPRRAWRTSAPTD
jgi:hypothetical protein